MTSTTIPGFGGTVIRPNEAGYDAARAIWNAMHDRRPALIARPRSPQDVAAAIRYARAEGLLIAVRGGGHSILFWALRGGGGNFGIVTEFEFALHELSELLILATFHPLEEARQVIERGRREMADPAARDELLWTSFLRRGSDVPSMTPEFVGRHGIMSLVEWSGDPAEGRAVLTRIQEELQPAVSDLSIVPFLFMQTITDDLFAHGLRTYIKAGFANDLPDALIDALLERAASIQSPISQVELLALGGAIARVDSHATAFPFRQARWLINIPATWRDAADDQREIAWARATYAAVKPYLSEGNYVNFMGDDEDDTAAGAYGRTIERLARIKAVYDPDNVFQLNQNIKPAASPA